MRKALVIFVGNMLMLDDGIGPACYQAFRQNYQVGAEVDLLEAGCLTADLVDSISRYDFVLTVDAVDRTGLPPGTMVAYGPSDMARLAGTSLSLHDLKLADLFDMAMLCGYTCEGFCLGMQVGNSEPDRFTIGLTPACEAAIVTMCEAVAAELRNRGFETTRRLDCLWPGNRWHQSKNALRS